MNRKHGLVRGIRCGVAALLLGAALHGAPATAAGSGWVDHTVGVLDLGIGPLIRASDGNYYGYKPEGVNSSGQFAGGALQQVVPAAAPGGNPTVYTLYNFPVNDSPNSLFQGQDGNLYGSSSGEVFRVSLPATPGGAVTFTALISPPTGAPYSLVQGSDGKLYGLYGQNDNTSQSSGVFQVTLPATPGGAVTYRNILQLPFTVIQFGNYGPNSLIAGQGGKLYGSIFSYDSSNAHLLNDVTTVFALAPPASPTGAWAYSTVYTFQATGVALDYNDARLSYQGSDGLLYGTLSSVDSGLYGSTGSVFRLAPAGAGSPWTLTTLHAFADDEFGAAPDNLLPGSGGCIYGLTSMGGIYGFGTIFKLTPPASPGSAWAFTKLRDFFGGSSAQDSDGAYPGSIALAPDGSIYGSASNDSNYPQQPPVLFHLEKTSVPQQAPTWQGTTPPDGTQFTITATLPFHLPLSAGTQQAGDTVRIQALHPQLLNPLPPNAVLLPADGSPNSSASLDWTPPYAGSFSAGISAGDIQNSLTAPGRTYNFTVVKRNTTMVATPLAANVTLANLSGLVTLRVSAVLDAVGPTQPVNGGLVRFTSTNGLLCQAYADSTGTATCTEQLYSATLMGILGGGFTATYAGDGAYNPTSAQGNLINLLGLGLWYGH